MKCPSCWAEKTAPRKIKGIKGQLLTCLLLSPMKCQHCYHKFLAFLPRTWGLVPPDSAGTGMPRLRIVGSLEALEEQGGGRLVRFEGDLNAPAHEEAEQESPRRAA